MDAADFVYTLVKLFFGVLAVIFAIIVWSRTRQWVWVFIVLGILSSYAEVVYIALEKLGISAVLLLQGEFPAVKVILGALSPVFFITGFIFMISRRR